MAQDELKLLEEGNKMRQKYSQAVFVDPEFPSQKALADLEEQFDWVRVQELDNGEQGSNQIKVFDEGTVACDIR